MSSSEATKAKEKLEQYTSHFGKVALVGLILQKEVVKVGPLNDAHNSNVTRNLNGISEREYGHGYARELRFRGDYHVTGLPDIATKFIHTHCSATKPTIEPAVKSCIHFSILHYRDMKSFQAQHISDPKLKKSDFNPEACRMIVRINEAHCSPEIVPPYWHLEGDIYTPDNPGDVNSVYCTTLIELPHSYSVLTRLYHSSFKSQWR